MRSHPAHFISFGFGIGLAHVAQGTFGTLLAFPIFWFVQPALSNVQFFVLFCAMFGLGVWACSVTGKAIGHADHAGMVWDEIVAFLLVLFFAPPALIWQAFAFLLFRLFDIFKPFPIRAFERRFMNGFGTMTDDLIAAFYTLIALAAMKAVLD